jgi:hypothetical protein
MQRRATALLVFTLSVTSVVAGAAFHLCGMEGVVRTACCCHETREGSPELKRVDECCGALLLQGEHPTATAAEGKLGADSSLPMLAGSTAPPFCEARSGTTIRAPHARGSPSPFRPPLFVWHCSYLN